MASVSTVLQRERMPFRSIVNPIGAYITTLKPVPMNTCYGSITCHGIINYATETRFGTNYVRYITGESNK